ncbi:hypothetical protein AB0F81_11080 [Actinoplanes sp. NPDC024001]|uniref:hypothetical protein n=1 Tax=Actinoplanes sp. NPDC024001 TaxID=3154598 RepID=UPI0033CC3C72
MTDAVHGLSGVRLLRTRPWALTATVLLSVALSMAYNWAWLHVLPGASPFGMLGLRLALASLNVLLMVVPLVVVAALSGRRVTVGRALVVWVAAALLRLASNVVFEGISVAASRGGYESLTQLDYLADGLAIIVLVSLGVLARRLLPLPVRPVIGGRDALVLIVASFAVLLVPLPQIHDEVRLWVSGALWGLLVAGWSVAALVTSDPRTSEPAGAPADLGFQDR